MATFLLYRYEPKAEFKLVAVNQSSKASQSGKFWADRQGPLVAGSVSSAKDEAAA